VAAAGLIRIGCVKYLNARPLIHGWPGEVVFDHPSKLCQQLAEGMLDVALVSSFEFLRNPIYVLVDGVCVASHGPVHSVFLAHAGELAEIEEIEVDPASQTAVNLLRCLLAEAGLKPRLVARTPLIQRAVTPRLAKFFIGDQAIRFRDRPPVCLCALAHPARSAFSEANCRQSPRTSRRQSSRAGFGDRSAKGIQPAVLRVLFPRMFDL
jgi:predicted solute-binding protein